MHKHLLNLIPANTYLKNTTNIKKVARKKGHKAMTHAKEFLAIDVAKANNDCNKITERSERKSFIFPKSSSLCLYHYISMEDDPCT